MELAHLSDEKGINVLLVDGTRITVDLDKRKATVEDLWRTVSAKLGMDFRAAENFFIWGVNDELEVLLYAQETIHQAIDHWNSIEERYSRPSKGALGMMTRKGKPNKSDKEKKTINSRQLTRTMTLKSVSEGNDYYRSMQGAPIIFLFKPTAVLPLSIERNCKDQSAIHLFYLQAVHNVLVSNYPCDIEVALQLGGLKMQVEFHDYNPSVHVSGFMKGQLSTFVPSHLTAKKGWQWWEANLFKEFKKHTGKNETICRLLYLQLCRQWPYYGCVFFPGRFKQVEAADSFFGKQFQGNVRIGINQKGVHIVDATILVCESFSFEDIDWWDCKREAFALVAWGLSAHHRRKGMVQRNLVFESIQSELISDLLFDWTHEYQRAMQELVDKRRAQQETTALPPTMSGASHRQDRGDYY